MRTARSIHRTGLFRVAPEQLQAANDDPKAPPRTFACPECGTRYFQPQPCDWCPGQHTPISQPTER